jgi:hypothetical protein
MDTNEQTLAIALVSGVVFGTIGIVGLMRLLERLIGRVYVLELKVEQLWRYIDSTHANDDSNRD